jgi:hypothetical protein
LFKLDWNIKIGDLLTTVTIVVSVIALLISWSKDRYTKQKEQADGVRASVALAIAKLDRWQTLQLSGFQELQPVFVETSEMLAKDFNIITARDHLWKSINAQRTKISGKILDEQIESAYIGLFSHFPAIRPLFLTTIAQLRATEEEVLGEFLENTQQDVMGFEKQQKGYTSAMLGNALRSSAEKSRAELEKKSSATMEPVREFLFQVMSKPDSEILTNGLTPQPKVIDRTDRKTR